MKKMWLQGLNWHGCKTKNSFKTWKCVPNFIKWHHFFDRAFLCQIRPKKPGGEVIDEFFFWYMSFFLADLQWGIKNHKKKPSIKKKTHLSRHIDWVFFVQSYPIKETKKIKNWTKIKFMIFIFFKNCELYFFWSTY